MQNEKDTLRRQMRALLKWMTDEERRKESLSLADKITASEAFKKADAVYLFSPLKTEPSTSAVFEAAKRSGKKVAYPRCEGDEMNFYYVQNPDNLVSGAYDIKEPDTALCPLADPAENIFPIIIVPGLAFDASGARLGRGKGFYDKYLISHSFSLKMAFCFKIQVVEKVPVEATDVKMDCVVCLQICRIPMKSN